MSLWIIEGALIICPFFNLKSHYTILKCELFILEEFRLQRNPDNYHLLRRCDIVSSSGSPASSVSGTTVSCSISSNIQSGQGSIPLQQTQQQQLPTSSEGIDDKREFQITKVGLVKMLINNYLYL